MYVAATDFVRPASARSNELAALPKRPVIKTAFVQALKPDAPHQDDQTQKHDDECRQPRRIVRQTDRARPQSGEHKRESSRAPETTRKESARKYDFNLKSNDVARSDEATQTEAIRPSSLTFPAAESDLGLRPSCKLLFGILNSLVVASV